VARYARAALIAALALVGLGCPPPGYRFPVVDLNRAVAPRPARVLVGEHVVARMASGGAFGAGLGNWITVHVFPESAILHGTWVKRVRGRAVCEGAADVRADGERGLIVEWWRLEGTPDCASLANAPDVRTTLWLGPVCAPEGCDTLRVDDPDGDHSD
jgi:hypothetical protein